MTIFALPNPEPYRLGQAPLVQALAQVRYPLVASFETMAGVAPVQERLRDRFPYMGQEKVQEIAFMVGPEGAAGQNAESINWKFTNDDGMVLTLAAGSASLTAGPNYEGIEEFATVFAQVLDVLRDLNVSRCDRLGVKYLSLAASLPNEVASWRRWFNPELLGWVGSSTVDPARVASAVNHVQLVQPRDGEFAHLPGDMQLLVTHGVVPGNSSIPGIPPVAVAEPSYLFDVDAYVVGPQPFDVTILISEFRLFHNQIDSFFYWSLSEEGRKHFDLEYL